MLEDVALFMDSSDEEDMVVVAAAAVTAAAAAYYYVKNNIEEEEEEEDGNQGGGGGGGRGGGGGDGERGEEGEEGEKEEVENDEPEPTGRVFVNEVLNGRNSYCRDMFRMDKRLFRKLCDLLRCKRLLRDTLDVRIEEQLAIFLLTVGHNKRNRVVQERFHHSGETISRHFNNVLNAIVALASDFFQPPVTNTPGEIFAKPGNYYPYFENCVGAIGGTHIPAMVGVEDKAQFRNKEGFLSQNVIAACSFDLQFQYVLAGWEGSTPDQHILNSALRREDALHIPEGKYYLVDACYTNMPGFIAPYHGVRYRLSEFAGCQPENANELFNYRHSSLRSAVERSFGVLKARFPILKLAPPYSFAKQIKIVIATCVIHNYIRREKRNDWLFRMYNSDRPPELEDPLVQPDTEPSEVPSQRRQREGASQLRDSIRDAIWRDYLMHD